MGSLRRAAPRSWICSVGRPGKKIGKFRSHCFISSKDDCMFPFNISVYNCESNMFIVGNLKKIFKSIQPLLTILSPRTNHQDSFPTCLSTCACTCTNAHTHMHAHTQNWSHNIYLDIYADLFN